MCSMCRHYMGKGCDAVCARAPAVSQAKIALCKISIQRRKETRAKQVGEHWSVQLPSMSLVSRCSDWSNVCVWV